MTINVPLQGHEEGVRVQLVHAPYLSVWGELHGRVGLRGVRRRRARPRPRRAAVEARLQPVSALLSVSIHTSFGVVHFNY